MKTVIVTGGTRGIGLAIATELATSSYQVIAIARRESDELKAAMDQHEGVQFHPFDLADIAAIPELVKTIRKQSGPIYGLVNNAGMGTSGLLANTKNEAIEETVRLNTVSPIVLTKYVTRGMMADGAGRIINIASIVSSTGMKGLSVYGATKTAMVGFTRSLARELGPIGITVNAIAPGYIDSAMTESLAPDQRERLIGRSALRRLAEPGDVAKAAQFLLSEGARNITGTVLTVDAGSTA